MHIEFRYFVVKLICQVMPKLNSSLDYDNFVHTIWNIPVETPPRNVTAILSSSVTFYLADKLLNKSNGKINSENILPRDIANKLIDSCELFCGDPSNDFCSFDLFIGGHGFLNCNFKATFSNRFYVMLFKQEKSNLFCFKSLFSNTLNNICCDEPVVPKTWVLDYINKAKSNNEELRKLVDDFHNTNVVKTKYENEDILWQSSKIMALALSADPEICIEPFLAGHGCKQNVPWLIDRFLTDSEKYIKKIAVCCDTSEIYDVSFDLNDVWFDDAKSVILNFREVRYKAMSYRRPDMLFKMVLKAVYAFYRYYNHPTWRYVMHAGSNVKFDNDVSNMTTKNNCKSVFVITSLLRRLVSGVFKEIIV